MQRKNSDYNPLLGWREDPAFSSKKKSRICARRRCGGEVQKHGTKNKKQDEARDAIAAARQDADIQRQEQPPAAEQPAQPSTSTKSKKRSYRKTSQREEMLKRSAIEFVYVQLGSPPYALWHGYHGTIPDICRILRLPTGRSGVGHRTAICRTLCARLSCASCLAQCTAYGWLLPPLNAVCRISGVYRRRLIALLVVREPKCPS